VLTHVTQFEDNEIAFVYGRINAHGNVALPTLEPVPLAFRHAASEPAPDDSKQLMAVLPRTTLIGDLKLTILRSKLTSLGLSAEFAGEGVLICSGGGTGEMEQIVAVRKTGRGQLSVEGTTGEVYFTVRKEVYALHALVAAYA
jgi:cleavage and polyadenylation specificity factor subunit 2